MHNKRADEEVRLSSGAFDEEIWDRGSAEIDITGGSHGRQVLLARFPILRGTHDHSAPDNTQRRTAVHAHGE
jgi:hypothetical protein